MSSLTKIWTLLTAQQRRAFIVLFILMLIGMVLETLGVGMVVPALAVMTEKDLAAKYPIAVPLMDWLRNPDSETLVVAGMLVLVAVYALKTAFLAMLAWRQMRFAFGVQAELSQRLFAGYLRQPYTFHLRRNSAQLIRNAIGETDLFAKMALTAGITLLTETLVVTGISILLFFVEPLGALVVVTTLGLAGWAFHYATHRNLLRWGAARQLHEGLRLQHLQQGLGGIKVVKILGREATFLENYRTHCVGSARAARQQSIMQQMPRLALELLAVAGLAALVLTMVGQGKPIDTLLPTLGLFAAAAFRLMPSATRMMSSAQNVRYSLPTIDVLHEELHRDAWRESVQQTEPIVFDGSLAVEAVSFRFPGSDAWALREVTARIGKGESIGIVGGSGSGKSTLIDVMLGLLTPTDGSVLVDGRDIRTNLRGWQDKIGYVPQSVFLTDDTLRRNIAFGLPDVDIVEADIWRALRSAQLDTFVQSQPEGLDTMVGERGVRLSGGQLQRIGIARALYNDPPLIVLDEATSALDGPSERGVMEAVRALQGQKTVVIVAHRLSTVEHCERIIRLHAGRVIQEGNPEQVLGEIARRTEEIRRE
jgi:ABC-type multidrug transport system fused ATPase/permease subunit